MALPRTSRSIPLRTSSFTPGDLADGRISNGAKKAVMNSPLQPPGIGAGALQHKIDFFDSPLFARMQSVVQQMLHSEHGVPIKSHKRRLISAIPSAFTGADVVSWLTRNLSIQSKAEALHLANLLCRHGYFFCIEGDSGRVKDDGSLYRFQTPYYWPSQNPDVSDFAYGVYLVKQVLRSKHRIRLLDYELKNLHKLKLRLAREWKTITEKADDDVKVFREQKRVARAIMSSQEEAFWRLYRPPPGESSVQDSVLTRHGTERQPRPDPEWTEEELKEELAFLKRSAKRTRWKVSAAVESLQNFCHKYKEFDPMLTPPVPSNPWVTGDTTLWTLENSLVESPSERQVKKWACSFDDLLNDVNGRYHFEEYCKSQYNHENIRFWQACVDLKSLPLSAVPGSVQLVYDEFLERGAASEVNISARALEQVEEDLKDPSRYAFSAAQEEIYHLMQNDIYPRFLKGESYQRMLRKGKEVGEAGKGFFAKLQKKKLEVVTQDASLVSPCLPQRYTKRQLSISRRLSTGAGSSSLDNLFLATNSSPFAMETKRKSAYTEAFIDSLMAPAPGKVVGADKIVEGEVCGNSRSATMGDPRSRQRRVSAPETQVSPMKSQESTTTMPLDEISEGGYLPVGSFRTGGLEGAVPMSYSADDLQQLMEDADAIGPSKWKKFGLAAGIDFGPQEGVDALQPSNFPQRCFSDNPHNMEEAAIRETIAASPRYGKAAYEFESLDQQPAQFLMASSESVHSTHSH